MENASQVEDIPMLAAKRMRLGEAKDSLKAKEIEEEGNAAGFQVPSPRSQVSTKSNSTRSQKSLCLSSLPPRDELIELAHSTEENRVRMQLSMMECATARGH